MHQSLILQTGKATDGNDIFMDFINSSNISTYYGDIFKKYKITHVILYKNSKMNMLITNADSEKYKEIYSDDNFVIYEVIMKKGTVLFKSFNNK